MKRTLSIAVVLAATLLALGGPATADRGGHGHFGHRGHAGVSVLVGPLWWESGWWGPYPYYYPYYRPTTIVVQPPPEIYLQQGESTDKQAYWYYCKEKEGYYPFIDRCPSGWLKIVPPPRPAE